MSHADPVAPAHGAEVLADEPFSAQLRRRTWGAHAQAEGEGFVDALFRGDLTLDDYTAMTTAYYYVYGALEQVADGLRSDPIAAEFIVVGLEREPALAADLDSLIGPGWQDTIAPSPVTQQYVDRIRSHAATSGLAYVAHAYTRYLGDLSGGQMMRKRLVTQFGFEGTDRVSFYAFPALGPLGAFKEAYRARLDSLPLDAAGREALILEVIEAYRLNVALFDELESARLARR